MRQRRHVMNSEGVKPGSLIDLGRQMPGNYTYGQRPASPGQQPLQPRRRAGTFQPEDPITQVNAELPGQAERPVKKKRHAIRNTFIVLFLLVFVAGGWTGWKLVSNEVKIFGWNGIWSLLLPSKLKGEDRGHVNILLAGNSADDAGHAGGDLTDSIMVASINTHDKTAFLISIPRDLYVDIPDNGYAKINEVYQDGQQSRYSQAGYPPGGMGMLQQVVSESLGIPIDYYALVDYSAVRDAVNAVGGITVNIQSSDPRGLYDPSVDYANKNLPLVKLTNGSHTLNGAEALGLARARGNSSSSYGFPQSDFNRSEHQRQILVALKDKATSAGTLGNPFKLGRLFDSFGNNVQTDMSAGEARRLYELTKSIPNDKIQSVGLNNADGTNLLASYTTRFGQSALVPKAGIDDYSEIQGFVQNLTGQSGQ